MKPHGIIIYTASLEKGVEFYRTLLGVEPTVLQRDRGFASFDLNGFELIVHESPVKDRPQPILELEADPDEFHQRLRVSSFDTPPSPSDRNYGLRQLNVMDPDGNKIAIVKPLKTN